MVLQEKHAAEQMRFAEAWDVVFGSNDVKRIEEFFTDSARSTVFKILNRYLTQRMQLLRWECHGMSHQSQPSPQFEMPKGTVPGRRSKEVSADGQRDLPGVCARQVSNP